MSDALHDALQPVLDRWTMGGAGAPVAPEWLKEKLGDDPEEAELRLLAVTGQALGMMIIPEPTGRLTGLPDLPDLALPVVTEALRPMTKRLMARRDEWIRTGILRLLESRGRVMHPEDWMPPKTGDIPDVYVPWRDWMDGARGADVETDPSRQWDDLGPSGKIALIGRLRATRPRQAVEILEARMADETPDSRAAMVAALANGLDASDEDFLRISTGDRAPRVRTMATRLLSRLGRGQQDGGRDMVVETAEFFRVTERNGRRLIVMAPERGSTHRNRCRMLVEEIDAETFASALGIPVDAVPGAYPWGADHMMDQTMAAMLLGTGSAGVVRSFEDLVRSAEAIDLYTVTSDARRLSDDVVDLLTMRTYATHSMTAAASMTIRPGTIDDEHGSGLWRQMMTTLQQTAGVSSTRDEEGNLLALGILLTAGAAARVLTTVTAAGIPIADPRLDALRVNASLR